MNLMYVTDAREYVQLAETAFGRIPKPMTFAAVWGDSLAELDRQAPDLRVINAVTVVDENRLLLTRAK